MTFELTLSGKKAVFDDAKWKEEQRRHIKEDKQNFYNDVKNDSDCYVKRLKDNDVDIEKEMTLQSNLVYVVNLGEFGIK